MSYEPSLQPLVTPDMQAVRARSRSSSSSRRRRRRAAAGGEASSEVETRGENAPQFPTRMRMHLCTNLIRVVAQSMFPDYDADVLSSALSTQGGNLGGDHPAARHGRPERGAAGPLDDGRYRLGRGAGDGAVPPVCR